MRFFEMSGKIIDISKSFFIVPEGEKIFALRYFTGCRDKKIPDKRTAGSVKNRHSGLSGKLRG